MKRLKNIKKGSKLEKRLFVHHLKRKEKCILRVMMRICNSFILKREVLVYLQMEKEVYKIQILISHWVMGKVKLLCLINHQLLWIKCTYTSNNSLKEQVYQTVSIKQFRIQEFNNLSTLVQKEFRWKLDLSKENEITKQIKTFYQKVKLI